MRLSNIVIKVFLIFFILIFILSVFDSNAIIKEKLDLNEEEEEWIYFTYENNSYTVLFEAEERNINSLNFFIEIFNISQDLNFYIQNTYQEFIPGPSRQQYWRINSPSNFSLNLLRNISNFWLEWTKGSRPLF